MDTGKNHHLDAPCIHYSYVLSSLVLVTSIGTTLAPGTAVVLEQRPQHKFSETFIFASAELVTLSEWALSLGQ